MLVCVANTMPPSLSLLCIVCMPFLFCLGVCSFLGERHEESNGKEKLRREAKGKAKGREAGGEGGSGGRGGMGGR